MILSDKPKIEIYNADCLEKMKDIPDKSINLVVTSPPYDNLRDYGGYVFNFEGIAKELYRLMKQGGVIVWVVGDQTIDGSETGTSFKQALYFKEIGFNLHDTMIYFKRNYLPQQEINKRYAQSFEYMFILSNTQPKTFHPFFEKSRWGGIAKVGTFRGKNGKTTPRDLIVNENKIIANVWNYEAGYMKSTNYKPAFEHPAMFPEKLAYDHILSWSNAGDTVLDPMMGSGTTGKMAKELGRNFIGIEISSDYFEIAKNRINQAVKELFV